MAHFVPCRKEITAKKTVDLFIDNFYKIHGVPKVIVSYRDPRFVGKFWQIIYEEVEYQTQYEYG